MENSNVFVHTDEPILKAEQDTLDRKNYASDFARLAEICETPIVIGLYGSWGIGKTSLMKLIEQELDKAKVLPVWFDSWQHELDENPVLALAQTLVKDLDFKKINQAKKIIKKKLTLIGLGLGSRVLQFTTGLKVFELLRLGNVYERERFQIRDAQVRMKDHFEKLVNTAKSEYGDKERLVFFIDDLDRCSPDNTLNLLEALKLYLNVKGCVYFIGVDREALELSVKQRYKDVEINASEYLDKIIQLPFFIPLIDPTKIKAFISPLILEELDDCKDLLAKCLGQNPRQVKRFINTLTLNHQLAKKDPKFGEYDARMLVILLMLQLKNPRLFRDIAIKLESNEHLFTQITKDGDIEEEIKNIRTRLEETDDQLYEILKSLPTEKINARKYIYLTKVASLIEPHQSSTQTSLGVEQLLLEARDEIENVYNTQDRVPSPGFLMGIVASLPQEVSSLPDRKRLALMLDLLARGETADVYVVSYLLRSKPDPTMFEELVKCLKERKHRGTTLWQALDALYAMIQIEGMVKRLADESLKKNLVHALARAAKEHPTKEGEPFRSTVVWGKILQICRLIDVQPEQIFPEEVLERIPSG